MTANVKVGGTWYESTAISAKVSGAWKNVTEGYTRIGGLWKQFFASGPAYYGAWLDGGVGDTKDIAHDSEANLYLIQNNDLVKIDPTGTIVWNRESSLTPFRLAVKGTSVVFNSSAQIVMYNTSGVFQWAKTINHDTNDVDLDASGNVYIAGDDSSNYSVLTKLDSTGAVLWTRRVRAENDTANRHTAVFVDDANSIVYVGGQMAEAGIDHLFWESYDFNGALQYRTKSNHITEPRQLVAGSDRVVLDTDLTSGQIYTTTLTGSWEDSLSVSSTNGFRSSVAIDPSGYYYWLANADPASGNSYFYVQKLDAADPLTTVWTRQIAFGNNITQGGELMIDTDGTSVWVMGRAGGSAQDVLFCIAADGSTTGSVTLNGLTYTIENGPTRGAGSASANSDTYSTATTAATSTTTTPTDTTGDFTLVKDRF